MKNKILKGSLYVAITLEILSACALDSESILPLIICGISTAYLTLLVAANLRG